MSDALLTVSGVVAGYRRDLPILHGISLEVHRGELVTIVGPNGAGKSTLIKAIAGLVPISEGRVELDGTDITSLATHKMGSASVAYVPQTDNVFTTLTIDENLRLGAAALPRSLAKDRIAQAYKRFPALRDHRDRKARVLSGGQRQLLAFARSLLTEPALLMLDEPSAGLSPAAVSEVFGHLTDLSKDGITILMVEQNVKAALAISDRTYVFAEGENRIDGPSGVLADDPDMKAIYFGGTKRSTHAASAG
ncbi:ABC transporter ATP-binding protein [Tropicimonas sp. IMCC34011]|uniref:ABC transporter ATP-binding protein n=1 Tax=Tropicimonas sp. IMCC34011 TaxID=2248759 RepID=UPI000E240324|nr:ABC transporter ATP-binding protein [Tropicimonas sp. IMCC34011]